MNLATMQSQIRFGMISLLLAGILLMVNIMVRGPFSGPDDPAALARVATAPLYVPVWIMAIASAIFYVIGYVGLFQYFEQHQQAGLGYWGMLLSTIGIILLVPLWGMLALTAPTIGEMYLAGNETGMQVFRAALDPQRPAGIAMLAVSGIASLIGTILYCIGFWRIPTLPNWLIVPFFLHALLLIIPITTPWLEPWGTLMQIIAAGGLIWKTWPE
jgi:hypothetical protein